MTKHKLRPPTEFGHAFSNGYSLLPFRFLRWADGSVLVTNECGEFEFLPCDVFADFAQHKVHPHTSWYADLKSKHFLRDSESSLPLDLLATKVRTKRSFLDGFTRLHMFVVTLRCNNACSYCQVSRVSEDRTQYDMSFDTAARATDWTFRAPAEAVKIEFQGGEPTLNWPVVAHVVKLAEERAAAEGRVVEFVIATNLMAIDDDILRFCAQHRILLSTSLDGPSSLHNLNRPRPANDGHERLRRNLARARAFLGHDQVSALMTATPDSLRMARAIVDEYLEMGFDSVFLRSVSPYGFARTSELDKAYGVSAFFDFYKEALEYIIDLNRRGTRVVESYTQMLLRKILTPFPVGYVDLQSPAGTVLGALVYNYDGDVYASDEGRMLAQMGDTAFRLGNLAADDYQEVMRGPRVRALVEQSCLETMPGCSECAFGPYCGADPVRNWALQGDIVGYRPTSDFCKKHKAIFEDLFDRLRHGDPFTRRLFLAWASQ